jgi:amidohydrolase
MNEVNKIRELRHHLHRQAELSGMEKETNRIIADFIRPYKPWKIVHPIGGNGLAAIFRYGDTGPTILFRSELDALPILEPIGSLAYSSRNRGVSHKCGHDGHMAMVAGLAPVLSDTVYPQGRVILLFQPAEETGEGAMAILDDPAFCELNPDYVFALHNLPGFSKNCIVYRDGIFTAAVQSMIIRLKGVVSHAAEPEKGINPSAALAQIILLGEMLSNPESGHPDFSLITPVYATLGQKAYGMSAGTAEIHYTLRAWSSHKLDSITDNLREQVDNICHRHELDFQYEIIQKFASSENDPHAVALVKSAAQNLGLSVNKLPYPFKWGEDFGLFTQRYKGAIFGIGAGLQHAPLHHEDYDFPDELLMTGIKMFTEITALILNPSD